MTYVKQKTDIQGRLKDQYKSNKLERIEIDNFQFYIPESYKDYYLKQFNKSFSIDIVKTYLQPNSTFIDIGAHYGYYSLIAYHAQKNIKIIAVETDEEKSKILQENFIRNNIVDSKILKDVATDFNLDSNRGSRKKFKSPNVTSNSLFEEYHPDFIKIDLDGYENNILSQLEQTIKKNKKLIMLVAFNPKMQKKRGYKPDDLLEKLYSLDFELYLLDEKNKHYYRLRDNKYKWQEIMPSESLHANLFCVKKANALFGLFFGHVSELGGAERNLSEIVRDLPRCQSISHVVLPREGSFINSIQNRAISHEILDYTWWANMNHVGDIDRCINSFINISRYSEEIEKMNPDVIYSNSIVIPWGGIIAFLINKPHVWFIREFGGKDHQLQLVFDLSLEESLKLINVLSDKVIYDSKAIEEYYRKYISLERGEVIYEQLTLPDIKKTNEIKPFLYPNSLKLILVGAMHSGKGQDQAVDAVIELIIEGYNVELLLLGPYDENDVYVQKIQKKINKSNSKRIHIKNFVENPGVFVNRSDVLLMCSKSESFGRVTIEAMLHGKPVIGAKEGATVELIQEGRTGLFFEYGNIHSLKEKIVFIYLNREEMKVMGKNAEIWSKETFSNSGQVNKIYEASLRLKGQKRKEWQYTKSYILMLLMNLKSKNVDKEKENLELRRILDTIMSAKTFKLWQGFNEVKKDIKEYVNILKRHRRFKF
jgi:FkbM family methyltransferase